VTATNIAGPVSVRIETPHPVAPNSPSGRTGTAGHRGAEWAVAALALSVALAAFVLIGLGVADSDGPPPGTSGTLAP
jgi:hypothetical protein